MRSGSEAYIKSQAHEGWRLIPDRYDGGAFSGASLDSQQFGEIPRLARLQELLNKLLTNGVAVLAGTYSFSRLRNPDEVDGLPFGAVLVVVPDKPRMFIDTSINLCIRFAPSLVSEAVLPVYTGVSEQDFDPAHIVDEIPF